MKTLLSLIGLSVFLLGCKSVPVTQQNADGTSHTNIVQQFDAQKAARIMHRVIPPAVQYANTTAPQYRKYIVDAQVAACSLVGSTNVTPEAIKAIFDQTGIATVKAPEIQGATMTIYDLYSAFYDDLVTAHLPQNEIVQDMTVLLQQLCNDLSDGLNSSPQPAK